MHTSPASTVALAVVVGLTLNACTAPATPNSPAASGASTSSAATPSGSTTTQASPAAPPTAPTIQLAQDAMDQVVEGWAKANRRAWDPAVWDAVDAYPNRLTDTRPITQATRQKAKGRYQPGGTSNKFTVKKVYASSVTNGVEALVLGGYYLTSKGKPVSDGDQLVLLTRTAGGRWLFTGFIPGSAIPGTRPGNKGPLVSFTPLEPVPGVDIDPQGAQASLLASMVTAASKGRATGIGAGTGNMRAGSTAWGGSYEVAPASRCVVPKGPAIATFEVKNDKLSLVQLDCTVTLKARPNSNLYWTDEVTKKRVTGTRFTLRILYEALVSHRDNGYIVVAHNDHWISNPRRG